MSFSLTVLNKVKHNDRSFTKVSCVREVPLISDDGIVALVEAANIGKNTSLKEIEIHEAKITNKGAQSLTEITLLEKINLSGNDIEDAGTSALSIMPNLNSLSLSQNQIGDLGAKALAEIKTIKSLALFGNPNISDEGWKAFLGNSVLVEFIIDEEEFTDSNLYQKLTEHIEENLNRSHLVKSPSPILHSASVLRHDSPLRPGENKLEKKKQSTPITSASVALNLMQLKK